MASPDCRHNGYHDIHTIYDRDTGLLVYFWRCDECGERLGEVRREDYRPRFDPQGNAPFQVATR